MLFAKTAQGHRWYVHTTNHPYVISVNREHTSCTLASNIKPVFSGRVVRPWARPRECG